MSNAFAQLGLNSDIVSAITALGYETPSEIQTQAIPLILENKDVVGLSQTGSGKTAAFSLPLIQQLDLKEKEPQILVVCPTRELSQQVSKAIEEFAKDSHGIRVANLYGGASFPEQIQQLRRNPKVIVGTPGRLIDHLGRNTLVTDSIKSVVLDEADRMLDMGFRDEVHELLEYLPKERQNIFFSATINRGVKNIIDQFSPNAEVIHVEGQIKPADTITQSWIDVREGSKLEVLRRLIMKDLPKQAVIFCNTKRRVEEAADALSALGLSADRLHGDMSQPMRERVLERFKDAKVKLLIATDVAGRGLDVAGVEAVYNLEMPQDTEDYVHRVGRTGRAGRKGKAYSLVSRRDFRRLQNIERYIGERIDRTGIPSSAELILSHEKVLVEKLMTTLEIKLEPHEDGTPSETPNFHELLEFLDANEADPAEITLAIFETWKKSAAPQLNSIPEDRPQKERNDREPRERRDRGDRGDRGERRGRDRGERRGRERQELSGPAEGFEAMFVGVGTFDGISPGNLSGMFYNEAGLSQGTVGRIQLFKKHAIVDIKSEEVGRVMDQKKNFSYRKRNIPVRKDRGFNKD